MKIVIDLTNLIHLEAKNESTDQDGRGKVKSNALSEIKVSSLHVRSCGHDDQSNVQGSHKLLHYVNG